MKQDDYQAIADLTAEALSFPHIKIRVKNIWGGGRFNRQYITIPKWIATRGETFEIYYIVHEVCHYEHVTNGKPLGGWHDNDYKRLEERALKLWDITIERKKIYPKRLYVNGQPRYDSSKWDISE